MLITPAGSIYAHDLLTRAAACTLDPCIDLYAYRTGLLRRLPRLRERVLLALHSFLPVEYLKIQKTKKMVD